ncbi:hypothetical protein QBC43DRAFT_252470 [Cladorrhinum sp. PSN259]|nr:hypothetical protein QBC43DRAFT_252470 [Cladorrhinum sp. PSN259]
MFGSKQPRRVGTDDVVPARFWDATPFVTVKLEIHIPKIFNSERPAVRFEHLVFHTNIRDHPLASRFPQATEAPSIQEGGDKFRELGTLGSVKYPETLEDYFTSDEPPFALQVISFRDATLVSLNFPHAVTDALGLSALLENWSKVLAGREDEVLPLPTDDPMDRIDSQQEEEAQVKHVLQDKQLKGFGLVVFGLYFLWDLLFGPKMETRVVCLPARSVAALQQRAKSDLTEPEKKNPQQQTTPFISEGDIITSLGIKSIASSLGQSNTRSLAIINVFELRSRLSNIFESSKFAYVQNAFSIMTCILSAQDARRLSLGQTALRVRETLVEQTADSQIRTLVRDHRAFLTKTGRPMLFGDKNSMLAPMTSWSKGKFYDVVDFAPAVLDVTTESDDAAEKGRRRGKPSFFFATESSSKKNPTYRNVWNILGKDPQGNYWITGMLSPATWRVVEEELKRL